MKMIPRNNLKRDVTLKTLEEMAARTKNWGKWGPDDQLGTLNYVTPEDIVKAAALVKKGKAFALGLDFNSNGPQRTGWGGRFNPIHTMLATGTDAVAGTQDAGKIRYADDMVSMPLQCGTQWDALGHIFYGDKMWNGYDARLVDSTGAKKNGIHKTRDRMIGPRRAARHPALSRRRLPRGRLRRSATPSSTRARRRRAWRCGAAIS